MSGLTLCGLAALFYNNRITRSRFPCMMVDLSVALILSFVVKWVSSIEIYFTDENIEISSS